MTAKPPAAMTTVMHRRAQIDRHTTGSHRPICGIWAQWQVILPMPL